MIKKLSEKYFGPQLKDDVRMFNLVSFLSMGFTLVFALLAILFRLETSLIVLSLIMFAVATYTIHESAEMTYEKNVMLFIGVCDLFCFPFALITSQINYAEIPVYYLIGITEELVLIKGKKRYIIASLQAFIDLTTMFYTFFLRTPYDKYYASLSKMHYVRLEFAILTTGFICGGIIIYRNYLINEEIKRREILAKEAEQVSYAKDMFLVNVSHEIRTPLNAIIGTTDVLLESNASNRIKEMAFNISNSSHALLSITTDLLDFSRINIDEIKITDQKYDISLMLKDVINLINVRLLDSNIEFHVDINPELPKVLVGDSGKIRQIFVNLLTNAIKYTKEGHVVFKVDFKKEEEDKIHLFITVKDTGIGIREDMLEKIFEPYNRSGNASTDHAIEGNGLGLAFCRHLSEAMSGNLWAESTFGKGSTFYFDVLQSIEIPYNDGECGSVTSIDKKVSFFIDSKSEMHEMGFILSLMGVENSGFEELDEFLSLIKNDTFTHYIIDYKSYESYKYEINQVVSDWSKIIIISNCNYSYSGEPFEYVITKPVNCLNLADLLNNNLAFMIKKNNEEEFVIPDAAILVVDDNLVNLDVAGNMLAKYNANIIKAASGFEAIKLMMSNKIDIVFLDYMMPGMDGIDTLKEIRKLPGDIGKVPVIALTANVVSGARAMFLNAGFDDYLSKPIESEKMKKTLLAYIPNNYIKYSE